jgi:uncharacterized protein (TIGR03084 family)
MPDTLSDIIDDLEAEQAVLSALLASLPDEVWGRDSPAEGWTLRDCVAHLAETDESAAAAAEKRPPVQRGERQGLLTAGQLKARTLAPAEVLTWYRHASATLISVLRAVPEDERIIWAGRPMSARSYTTARLMEHWSHGLDIHDAAGVTPVDTDRLRHIAYLGYITRDFAYGTHGRTAPATPLYVELTAPSGAVWSFGPKEAPDRIYGPAGDFCRVVTQRIHPSDTALRCEGDGAFDFLSVAQAFAGPPGTGRPSKGKPENT